MHSRIQTQEKINHLMYMDDIELLAKNEKELETLIHTVRIYSQDKRQTKSDRRNGTTKSRQD